MLESTTEDKVSCDVLEALANAPEMLPVMLVEDADMEPRKSCVLSKAHHPTRRKTIGKGNPMELSKHHAVHKNRTSPSTNVQGASSAEHATVRAQSRRPPCSSHGQPSPLFCTKCQGVVCMDCVAVCITDHREHLLHMDTNEFTDTCSALLDGLLQTCKMRIRALQQELKIWEQYGRPWMDRPRPVDNVHLVHAVQDLLKAQNDAVLYSCCTPSAEQGPLVSSGGRDPEDRTSRSPPPHPPRAGGGMFLPLSFPEKKRSVTVMDEADDAGGMLPQCKRPFLLIQDRTPTPNRAEEKSIE